MTKRPIDSIAVGKRHRRDFSGVPMLADSIESVGLLQPVGVTPDGRLLWGECRLRACRQLGWTNIPVVVKPVDPEDMVAVEAAENFARKNFTPSEAVSMKRALEPVLKAKAEARMKAGKPLSKLDEGGRVDAMVASSTGMKRTTLRKADEVVAAAEADPRYVPLVEQMDDTGKVDRVFKMLKIARAREAYAARQEKGGTVADLVALAASGWRAACILVDWPWFYETYTAAGKVWTSAENHYATMTVDEIKAFAAKYVEPLAADDCTLFMWATWPLMEHWLPVISACGFQYKTLGFDWVKTNPNGEGIFTGTGYHTKGNSEPCLLATRGSPLRLGEDVHQVILAPVGAHSVKPDEVHDRIERLVAGPYLELFARRARPGWMTWGDEVPPAAPATSSGTPDIELRYVRHEAVEQFAAEGWQCTAGLEGTHHGEYSVLMQRPAPDDDDVAEIRAKVRAAHEGEQELEH